MPRYDTDVAWEDPSEKRDERRTTGRFDATMKLKILAETPEQDARMVGPGLSLNLSHSGALVVTKHKLEPRQRVTLSIPTQASMEDGCLPKAFVGQANVVRVQPGPEGCSTVAMRFGRKLYQNMEFVVFMESLQHQTRLASGM
jgi:PilZ domain